MIAPALGLKATLAGRTGTAVSRDPVAMPRIFADKMPA